MEPAKQGKAARNGRPRRKADLAAVLRKSWYHLRLSVRHPARVPTWDAVVLTAASPEQARLYEWQLGRAKRMGRIAAATAVPDPDGQHISSGAATLNAVRALAELYRKLGVGIAPGVAPILTSFAFDQNLEQVHDKFNIRHDNLFLTVNLITPVGEFDTSLPTPYAFMRRFLKAAGSDKQVRQVIISHDIGNEETAINSHVWRKLNVWSLSSECPKNRC